MCLAIYRGPEAEGRISTDELEASWESGNNDGYGAMYVDRGKVMIYKSTDVKRFAEFTAWIDELQTCNVPLGVHLRLATHGKKDTANAHPYEIVPGKLAVMHNGVLTGYDRKSDMSDTAQFAAQVATLGAVEKWWTNEFIWTLLAEYAGYSNKFVFLRHTGEARIINAKMGMTRKGVWYSNDSWKPRVCTAVVKYQHRGPYSETDNWPQWYRDQQSRLEATEAEQIAQDTAKKKTKKQKRWEKWNPAKESIWSTHFMGCTLHICGGCVKDAITQLETEAKYVLPRDRSQVETQRCEWCSEPFQHFVH